MIKSQRNKILKKMPNFEFMRDPTTLRTTEKVFVSVRATANQKWKYKPHQAKMLFQISKLIKKEI